MTLITRRRAAIAALAALSLGGCAQIQEDAASLIPKPPLKPTMQLANSADTSPPILQPRGYGIPDRSWDVEGASETAPWARRPKTGQVWPGYEIETRTTVVETVQRPARRAPRAIRYK